MSWSRTAFELSLPKATGLDMNSNRLPWSAPWMTNKEATRLSLLGSDARSRANHAQTFFRLTHADRRASTRWVRARSIASDRNRDSSEPRSASYCCQCVRPFLRLRASSDARPLQCVWPVSQKEMAESHQPVASRARAGAAGSSAHAARPLGISRRQESCKQCRRCRSIGSVRRAEQTQIALAPAARVGPPWRAPQVGQRMSSRDWIGIGLDRRPW